MIEKWKKREDIKGDLKSLDRQSWQGHKKQGKLKCSGPDSLGLGAHVFSSANSRKGSPWSWDDGPIIVCLDAEHGNVKVVVFVVVSTCCHLYWIFVWISFFWKCLLCYCSVVFCVCYLENQRTFREIRIFFFEDPFVLGLDMNVIRIFVTGP